MYYTYNCITYDTFHGCLVQLYAQEHYILMMREKTVMAAHTSIGFLSGDLTKNNELFCSA